jgi:4-carboxymuconolactone decarboxylase
MPHTLPRIPPVPRAGWTAAVRDVFGVLDRPDAGEDSSRFNIILTLANYPELAIPFLTFNRHLLRTSSLPERLREVAILRVACLCRCEYEWTQHVRIARDVGMSMQEIAAIKDGPEAPVWSELERHVLRAVEQLRGESTIRDETWNALATHLDRRQLMDFLFTAGNYTMLAMVMNAVGVELEPDQVRSAAKLSP